jgi:hypothetical protein
MGVDPLLFGLGHAPLEHREGVDVGPVGDLPDEARVCR